MILMLFWKKYIFGGNERGHHAGAEDPTIKLAHRVELLSQLLSQKYVFKNLGPEPPHPLKTIRFDMPSYSFWRGLQICFAHNLR